MNKTNTNKLLTRFKWLYREFWLPMNQTCMCWGFECGDGWFDILWNLSLSIENRLKPAWWQRKWPHLSDRLYYLFSRFKMNWLAEKCSLPISVRQVKEKFGTLSYYTSGWDDEIAELIDDAEDASSMTCETCGKHGKLLGRGWLYTACKEHAKNDDWDYVG